jgi:hypothetical protein
MGVRTQRTEEQLWARFCKEARYIEQTGGYKIYSCAGILTAKDTEVLYSKYLQVNLVCGECGQHKPDDDRVKNGMKCGTCAYGAPADNAEMI